MSKKHIGSSVADFLKEEGIFEEAQAQGGGASAGGQGSGSVAACSGHDDEKDLEVNARKLVNPVPLTPTTIPQTDTAAARNHR